MVWTMEIKTHQDFIGVRTRNTMDRKQIYKIWFPWRHQRPGNNHRVTGCSRTEAAQTLWWMTTLPPEAWRDAAGRRLRRHSDGWPGRRLRRHSDWWPRFHLKEVSSLRPPCLGSQEGQQTASSILNKWFRFMTTSSLRKLHLGPPKNLQEGFRNDLCFQKEKSKPIQAEQTPGSSLAPRNKRKPLTSL